MNAKVPQSMDNTLLLVGMLAGPLSVGNHASPLFIIILLAIGGFLLFRGRSLQNQGVGLVLRGMGLYVLSFGLGAWFSTIGFLPQWVAQTGRTVILTAGGVSMLRALLKIDNLIGSARLTQTTRNVLVLYIVWLSMTSFVDEYLTVAHLTFLFACLVYHNLHRCINGIKEVFYTQAGETYTLPTDVADIHPCSEEKPVVAAAAVVSVFGILLPDMQFDTGSLFGYLDKNLFGPSLVFPVIMIILIRYYTAIDRKVQGVGADGQYEAKGFGSLIVAVLLGLWAGLAATMFDYFHDSVIIVIGTLAMLATFAWIEAPQGRRMHKTVMSVIVNTVAILCGTSLIGAAVLVAAVLVMTKFMHFALHDMLSFGHSIQFTDNLGDFHVLNLETMRDESGNKWEEKR